MKNLVFLNTFHNGDMHLCRTFVKDLINNLSSSFSNICYEHHQSPKLMNDLRIKHVPLISFQGESAVFERLIHTENNLFLNTWIGQYNSKYITENGGCTLKAYYKMFEEIYFQLGLKEALKEEQFYIPEIDYSCYENIDLIRNFMSNKQKNIFIANQNVKSQQIENFSFDNSIIFLCKYFKDINFFVTGKTELLLDEDLPNLYFTPDVTQLENNDLNETGFISTFCNIIIGRSSGPYCFAQTKQNYFDSKKTFICFDNNIINGFWVTPHDNLVKAKTYAYKYFGEDYVTQTLFNHIKQVFY